MDNLRRFVVVFTLVIFLTLSICGIVLANSYRKTAHTEVMEPEVSLPVYDPSATPLPSDEAGGEFNGNILFIIGDADGSESELMVIVNVNTTASALNFMYIPKDMKFATSSDRTVDIMGNMLARKRTAESCANITASFFDMNIDYYVQMPCNVFASFIDAFDSDGSGISYTVPVDLKYTVGKYNIDLKKGTNVLHGNEALSLIQFYHTENNEYSAELLQYYDGTDIMRIKASQALLSSFLSQKLIKTGDKQYSDIFAAAASPFIQMCDTNITESDLKAIGKVMSTVSASGIRYYCFNGTDQYLDKYYIVYNSMCTNLISGMSLESDAIIKSDFRTN